jgi:hypothetical protein
LCYMRATRAMRRMCRNALIAAAVGALSLLIAAAELSSGGGRPTIASPALPAQLPAEPASFEERCTHPGVVLCNPVDDGRVRGVGVTGKTPNATLSDAVVYY